MCWFRKISILYRAPLPSKMYSLKLVDIKRKQAKPRSLLFEIPFVVVNLGRCPRLFEVAHSGLKIRIDLSRFPVSVILAYAEIQKYSQPRMELRMREGVLFKLEVQSLKVQMERLQWGFPIATALSLNKPHQSMGSKRKNKNGTSHTRS